MFVAKRLVAVAFVEVRFEIVALLITAEFPINDPTEIADPVAFVKLSVVTVDDPAEKLPVRANAVPVAPVKLKFEIVPFVNAPSTTKIFDPVAPLNVRYVLKRFVEVVFVPVAFVHVRFAGLKFVTDKLVNVPFVATMELLVIDPALRDVPVAPVKLSVVTVEDPADRLPVSANDVPVAFVNVAV